MVISEEQSGSRREETTTPRAEIILLYDGECPICRRYSAYVRLRQRMDFELRNARDSPELIADLKERGYDLNEGMALIWGEQLYLGRGALMAVEGLLSTRGFWDIPLRWVLRVPGVAYVLYPICKMVRWVLLRLLGKNPDLHAAN